MNEPLAELDAEISRLMAVLQGRINEADAALQQSFVDFSAGLMAVQAKYEERIAQIVRSLSELK
jgi:hypothetical protein